MPIQSTTQEFLDRAHKVHGNLYTYEKFIYEKSKTKGIVTCRIHGDFYQSPNDHLLKGAGCQKCGTISRVSPIIEAAKLTFLDRAKKVHGDCYDYSETVYTKNTVKMSIICRKHGKFEQIPLSHLRGSGCPLCGRERNREAHVKNPSGWGVSNWVKRAETSYYFEGFKVYLLNLSNDDESFYKIGRTYRKVTIRTRLMPYNVNILHEIKHEDPRVIFDLENQLKRKYKVYKYEPKLTFQGRQECFSLALPISDLIANYPTQYTPQIDDATTPIP